LVEFAQPAYPIGIRPSFNGQKLFLTVVAVLASTILLKVASIQYLEVLYFALLFVLGLHFVHDGYRATWYRPIAWLAFAYTAFCVAAIALALASLRFEFYLPVRLEFLKGPVIISLSRTAEIVASLTAMFYMAQTFGQDVSKAKFTMRIYFWTGFASGVYSLLSVPLNIAGLGSFGAYSSINRLRGFYNEGGPYGNYILSVLAVGFALEREGWLSRGHLRLVSIFLFIVFVFSYSKAGILALLAILFLNVLFARRASQRILIVGLGVAVLVVMTQIIDLSGALRRYKQSSSQYERLSHLHPRDPNFVYGRVAGAFIVPRMLEAHPLTGIGWGNYGLLRNAPEYRGASVFVEDEDDTGLGIFGTAAELGLPLFFLLLLCLIAPFVYLRSTNAPVWISNLALVQPIVHLSGAQLNLTYPWVVTSFALGLGFARTQIAQSRPQPQISPEL
jgi:hypothetical protein